MSKIIEKDGKKYLVMGNKAIPFNDIDAYGKPIIKVRSEEIKLPNGRKDVKIFVESLKVVGENKEIK